MRTTPTPAHRRHAGQLPHLPRDGVGRAARVSVPSIGSSGFRGQRGPARCGTFHGAFSLARLRRDGVRPDLLLVEVLPGLVSDARTVHDLSEDRMPADHLLWSDLPLLERYQAGTRTCLWHPAIVSEAATLYTHRFGILHALMPCLLSDHRAALVTPPGPSFIPDDPSPDQRARALDFARREYVPALIESNPDSSAGRVLHELLASCRQARYPAAVVLMPEGPTFRSWYPAGTLPKVRQWLKRLCRENGRGSWTPRNGSARTTSSTRTTFSGAARRSSRSDWAGKLFRRCCEGRGTDQQTAGLSGSSQRWPPHGATTSVHFCRRKDQSCVARCCWRRGRAWRPSPA